MQSTQNQPQEVFRTARTRDLAAAYWLARSARQAVYDALPDSATAAEIALKEEAAGADALHARQASAIDALTRTRTDDPEEILAKLRILSDSIESDLFGECEERLAASIAADLASVVRL